MKTRIIAFAFATVFVLALGVFVQAQGQPANIAGNCDMSLNTPGGTFTQTLSIEQDGGKIKGKMSSQMGDSTFEGTIQGNDLAFGSTMNTPQGAMSAAFKGIVSDDSIKGSATIGDFALDWTATRSK